MELKVNGKFVTSSKVKNHVALKIYGAPKLYTVIVLCSKMTSFPPSEGVSKITFGSICSRSLWLS